MLAHHKVIFGKQTKIYIANVKQGHKTETPQFHL